MSNSGKDRERERRDGSTISSRDGGSQREAVNKQDLWTAANFMMVLYPKCGTVKVLPERLGSSAEGLQSWIVGGFDAARTDQQCAPFVINAMQMAT